VNSDLYLVLGSRDVYLALGSLVIVVITIVGTEILGFIIARAVRIAGASRSVVHDVKEGVRIIAILIAVSAILTLTGLASEFTALTISGVAGLAISLALQSTLTNIISGILLLNDGVVHVGDTVEYSSIKGTVVRVALRNTWIKQEDGSIAVMSNSSLSAGPVVNRSATDRIKKKYELD